MERGRPQGELVSGRMILGRMAGRRERVTVYHLWQSNQQLSVEEVEGTLLEAGDYGIALRTEDVTRFFPWSSINQIVSSQDTGYEGAGDVGEGVGE